MYLRKMQTVLIKKTRRLSTIKTQENYYSRNTLLSRGELEMVVQLKDKTNF